jgi:uncharacterized membrane protein YjjP (DUF1212 family)
MIKYKDLQMLTKMTKISRQLKNDMLYCSKNKNKAIQIYKKPVKDIVVFIKN